METNRLKLVITKTTKVGTTPQNPPCIISHFSGMNLTTNFKKSMAKIYNQLSKKMGKKLKLIKTLMLSKKKLNHKIFRKSKYLYLVQIYKPPKNKMKQIILKILVKTIKSKTKNKTIGIFHRTISKMNGNGLQIQILKKVKMNLKLKRVYSNNRKTNKLKETKIC
jgi:hypothetical protein